MTCLKAVEAGVDTIDTALAPFALRSGPPAVEPMVVALRGTPRDTGLDLKQLLELGEYFESVASRYSDFVNRSRISIIDTNVLLHQIPGGMISNLVAQLRQSNNLHRLNEVYDEIPRVRKEMGYPPLVTPISQIVAAQSLQNVIVGRYKLVSTQLMDYCSGLYGRPPAPIDPDVQRIVLRYNKRGRNPITCRPADLLEPELDRARAGVKDFSNDIGDVLTYALSPDIGLRFLKQKYGIDAAVPT